MFRGKDRWVLHAVSEGRDQELRRMDPGATLDEMVPDAPGSGAPESQAMDRGDGPATVSLPLPPGAAASALPPRHRRLGASP